MTRTSDVPRVHVTVRALDRNHGCLLTGLSILSRQGRIRLTEEMQVPPPPLTTGPWHLRDKDDSNVEIVVDDKVTGFADFHDSWELNEEGLRTHDVYFKRSLDPARHSTATLAKLEPLGLVYEVCANGFDPREARRILTHKVAARTRARAFAKYVAGLGASWLGLGSRANLRRTNAFPDPGLSPRALFAVGLWDPATVARHDPARVPEFEAINRMRAGCVRLLRASLGDQFSGGTQHSAFARRYAPDTLMPDAKAASKGRYLARVRQHAICVATMGLHGSNGCKLAEYVALSRAIVSEPLRYVVPGPFGPGSHYLPFESPEQCLEQVQRLMRDDRLRETMMRANREYYEGWMRPDSFAWRVIERIRVRA